MTDEWGTERDARAVPATVLAAVGRRWAVLVGVSQYHTGGLDLQYAHRDAEGIRDLIVTPEGGNFATENIRLLCNEEATTAAVTRAVRGFLMEAVPDDLVLLFFACHGGPDPRRPSGPLYLYTYDTDPRDVAGTAFPMDEIDRSLRQLIQARRVVIIADTCHSGGIGGGPGGRSAASAEATNQYLAAMAEAKGGVALLTSAEAAESSLEDARWGGGHGVFTHYVLEGMRGAADGHGGEKDGIVSVGELFEYVRERVQQDTDGRQHPAIGTTQFDRKLPMAVTGDLDVAQHLALARRLVEVGWLLDDPAPMLLAAQQLGLAADLKRRLPSADADRGAALLAAGRHDEAITALRSALTAASDTVDAVASLHLGIAVLAERGSYDEATVALREYLRRAPTGDDHPWATAYADWLRRPGGRIRALLIGAGTFPAESSVTPLPGAASDVALLTRVLTETFGSGNDEIQQCIDDTATAAAIRKCLARLRESSGPDDTVVVYFTGHSIDTAGPADPYLIGHDDHRNGPIGISPEELGAALEMSAREVVLILDTHIAWSFLTLMEQRRLENVTVLLACGVGEVAFEKLIDGEHHGVFTAALAAELTAAGRDADYAGLIEATRRRVQSDPTLPGQTPQLAGPGGGRVLAGRFPLAGLWRAVHRQIPRESDVGVLQRAAEELDDPRAWWALGRRALVDGDADDAAALLERAVGRTDRPEFSIDVALAELGRGNPAAAAEAITAAAATVDGRRSDRLERALALLAEPTAAQPKLCVIAPTAGFDSVAMQTGCTDLTQELAATFDRSVDDVVAIGGRDATVATVRDTLRRHAESSKQATLIVFAGRMLSADGFKYQLADGDLPVADVRAVTTDGNLVVLLVGEELRDRDVTVPGHFPADVGFDIAVVTHDRASASTLIRRARRNVWAQHLTYGEWIDSVPAANLIPETAANISVIDRGTWRMARRHLIRAQRDAADDAMRLAQDAVARRRAQHEEHPSGHLQAGLAISAAGEQRQALDELRAARNLYDDPSINRIEHARDLNAGRWHLESRYHYGRLQYEHGDDLYDAVATLQAAVRQAPDDPRLLFHLAHAIRALVERESLVEARQHARKYLELGAPLGGAEELRDFVAPPAVR